ncbi:universal stress protein family protein [Geodermatophilus tzadiensis]|uniref:Universal stress protein family protein n=1 Tax=Geodermatophilus tzadiensis TaxID=1137988 RepID=A0A2T0TVL3_9ACTN|nr:universal stress protein family protein [Geodermatophilus tzadiensis]
MVAETGAPGDVFVRRAAGAGLLVVGSRRAGRALGPVALHCVVHAPCPVLVVRPERHQRVPAASAPVEAARG